MTVSSLITVFSMSVVKPLMSWSASMVDGGGESLTACCMVGSMFLQVSLQYHKLGEVLILQSVRSVRGYELWLAGSKKRNWPGEENCEAWQVEPGDSWHHPAAGSESGAKLHDQTLQGRHSDD